MNSKEVSQQTNTSINTIRYFERIGLIPQVKRNHDGLRVFTEADADWIRFIKQMREVDLSIEGLIEYVTLSNQPEKSAQARKDLLTEQRNELQDQINRLEVAKDELQRRILAK
ncbi:MerR family transcriptional regulator [Enterococcus plantarum]|uniref:MerR family transcriptional regulator n=1 Tax=Enterococcus plantarum TaxID=1077675 RepID=A0A2W4BI40_9ENTE|nr:MerR family transcriptional regulator [Enterococcus plantarum]MBO0468312.1 MerR family transcriptional regulator [Enterococcus plantarum]PZL76645.1 MerR family transcriptional regulator [Enterococcus plantarum]